jgi:phosphosulfolactate synthase (CoM biosynthesis protein A)
LEDTVKKNDTIEVGEDSTEKVTCDVSQDDLSRQVTFKLRSGETIKLDEKMIQAEEAVLDTSTKQLLAAFASAVPGTSLYNVLWKAYQKHAESCNHCGPVAAQRQAEAVSP